MTDIAVNDLGTYVLGEKPPPLVYVFLDQNGVAINLTGYTAKFVRKAVRSDLPVESNATITSPTAGEVTYTWGATDLAVSGEHWAEFWVGNTTNRFCSHRLEFVVRMPVGSVPNI